MNQPKTRTYKPWYQVFLIAAALGFLDIATRTIAGTETFNKIEIEI